MAPKRAIAKVKAKAKAKAAAKAAAGGRAGGLAAMRRPAGVRYPRLRRPAARGADPPDQSKWLKDVGLEELNKLGAIELKGAKYYHRDIAVAGKVTGVQAEAEGIWLEFEAAGTLDEGLLRSLSGKDDRKLKVHVCPADCDDALTGEFLLHGKKFVQVVLGDRPWHSNLEKVQSLAPAEDELEKLRLEAERLKEDLRKMGGAEPPEEKKKKKKKKDKERKSKDTKEKEDDDEPEALEKGKKSLASLFEGTGLDPDVRKRNKVLKRARRLGKGKKKKKDKKKSSGSSSEDSDSTTSSGGDQGRGLFEGDKKVKLIASRCPGALASTAVQEAKEGLLTTSGMTWNMERDSLPPLLTHYARQSLCPSMSPPMVQEVVTLTSCLDGLLQGRVAYVCDILSQRVKALGSTSRGHHWSIGRQMELVRAEAHSLSQDAEALNAARMAREEEKLRSLGSRPSGGRGNEGYGGNKGRGRGRDWKGNGKRQSDENPKGKGQDGKKEEPRGGWPKK